MCKTDLGTIPDLNFPLPDTGGTEPYADGAGVDGLFDFDLGGMNLMLEGFWDDFSLLGEGNGFPFR